MPEQIIRLGVLGLRRPPVTRWGAGELLPMAVMMPEPATAANTRVMDEAGTETWYLGGRDLSLWSGDTAYYRDNLVSGQPRIWVALRGGDPARAQVVSVSADPNEGEGLSSDLDLIVGAVPMPDAVRAIVAEFVDCNHVEIPFKRRKRSPTALSEEEVRGGPRVLQPGDKWGSDRGRGQRS
ncbi:DUF3305 domain-containing protein [Paracoccus hibiscisoli]|uniref:DUF3305 domain-containing protein n=1 Tax=Paracoccus hibiscisoli TaxID=2023261 RepID=A0A4U0QEH1_9RHOB|nr:DUF3305 domain-containing protein [Paracoccus hibiscisoli]TJZ79913.1 DUF3305 domain-containing protein [Paracoccus hibiscisoli]